MPTALLALAFLASAPRPAPRIEVQGHRGARALRPENTLPAFEYALEVGVDVLELDLVATQDDHLVVMHDPHLNPLLCVGPEGAAVPEGVAVRSLTLAQLKTYDCGAKQNPRFPKQVPVPGPRVPTLEALLEHVEASRHPAARKVAFNIELKLEPGRPELYPTPERFAELVLAPLKARGLLERVVIQSFDHRPLAAVKARAPKVKVAMLLSDNFPNPVAIARDLKAAIISPHHEWMTRDAVAALHAAGVKVVPWTANDEAAWARLVDMGVDGIITDDPAALIAYLKGRGLRSTQ
jgi:glycerophosphoryl diester phosphodiesterase